MEYQFGDHEEQLGNIDHPAVIELRSDRLEVTFRCEVMDKEVYEDADLGSWLAVHMPCPVCGQQLHFQNPFIGATPQK